MDLKIPNIVKPIALKEYAEEFGEAVIWVWVNPTRALRIELYKDIMSGEASEEQLCNWFSEIWSQGADDTHFTPGGVKELGDNCMDRDPKLWIWLIGRTFDLVNEHYITKKKILNTQPSS